MSTGLIILVTAIATYTMVLIVRAFTSREKKIQHQLEHLYGVRDGQFLCSMGGLLEPGITTGNRITPLTNGDEIFPAMLSAIRSAQRSIAMETFIYWSGDIGQEFAEALTERAGAGVKVHVLLDWLGSNKMDEALIQRMQSAGVEIERYHPLRWYNLQRFNNRTHRKLLVVDGRTGFTGGVGIADEWTGNAQDPDHWRDSHYQLEGPAVAQMQTRSWTTG